MSHFAPRSGFRFAVKMQLDVRRLQGVLPDGFAARPNVAEQICHRRRAVKFGRAERQTADGAKLLFKLRRDAGVKRQMPRIMRARRQLAHARVDADALGAGKLLALDLASYFADEISAFVESGKPIIGICNGFQALVKSGNLPGETREKRLEISGTTLTFNAQGHFECRWPGN